MSTVYATEPAASGRVVFETSHGPIEIELFCRECPQTTKLFLQLCLDGFYNDVFFHRIMKQFLIQTGAKRKGNPLSTADLKAYMENVSAEAALDRRRYEMHSRLRFNHRGQVAMAIGVEDDNDMEVLPQFFMTLDEAPFLDGKHVLFGTVSGPTIFNALRIGSNTDVDAETHQPTDWDDAPYVRSVRILDNPIHQDIVPRTQVPWGPENQKEGTKKRKKKRKGKLDVNVLSFGDEMDDAEATAGIKSSHDVVESRRLRKEVESIAKAPQISGELKPDRSATAPTAARARKDAETTPASESTKVDPAVSALDPPSTEDTVASGLSRAKPQKEPIDRKREHGMQSSLVASRRAQYVRKGSKNKKQREEDTMAKLMAFQSKVKEEVSSAKGSMGAKANNKENSLASRMARRAQAQRGDQTRSADDSTGATYHGQVLESDGEDETGRKGDWLRTRFKCRRHVDHGAGTSGDGRDVDDYEVVDDRDNRKRDNPGDQKHRDEESHRRHRKRHKKHRHEAEKHRRREHHEHR